ncbi:hypothetical protein V6N13_130097 [Hibiscus sabdariffa]
MTDVSNGMADLSLGEEDEIAIAVEDVSDEQTITFDLCFVGSFLTNKDGGKSLNWWDQFSVKSGTANQSISKPNNSAQLTPSPGVGITVSRGKITEHLGRSGKVFHGPSAALGLGFGQPGGSSVPVVDINMDLGEDHSLFNPNDALKRPRQHSAVSGSKDFNESNIILLAGLAQRASREQ